MFFTRHTFIPFEFRGVIKVSDIFFKRWGGDVSVILVLLPNTCETLFQNRKVIFIDFYKSFDFSLFPLLLQPIRNILGTQRLEPHNSFKEMIDWVGSHITLT